MIVDWEAKEDLEDKDNNDNITITKYEGVKIIFSKNCFNEFKKMLVSNKENKKL